MNKCHAIGCTVPIGENLLMCKSHWYSVPKDLRDEVWAAWGNGEGAGTTRHIIAMEAAILAVAVKEGKIAKDKADARLSKLKEDLNAEAP